MRGPVGRGANAERDPAAWWEAASESERDAARSRATALSALGARLVSADRTDYPEGLRALADPPRVLVVIGEALPPRERTVAMVGSRAASDYGIAQARRLAADLARLGFTIASGLARGIDAAAHRGALEAGGRTVAVLPGSIDELAPPEHAPLARAISRSGALVSEHVARTPVNRWAFVRRNRLIAALSAATLVVEADERSGALHTAAAASRLGRPLLAVPGDVDRPTASGVMRLLRAGARPCADAGDVLASLDLARPRRAASAAPRAIALSAAAPSGEDAPPGTAESRVLAALDRHPRLVEAVAAAAGLSAAAALAALLRLEWAGAAEARPGSRWTLARDGRR
jgi:DNA processing protein